MIKVVATSRWVIDQVYKKALSAAQGTKRGRDDGAVDATQSAKVKRYVWAPLVSLLPNTLLQASFDLNHCCLRHLVTSSWILSLIHRIMLVMVVRLEFFFAVWIFCVNWTLWCDGNGRVEMWWKSTIKVPNSGNEMSISGINNENAMRVLYFPNETSIESARD